MATRMSTATVSKTEVTFIRVTSPVCTRATRGRRRIGALWRWMRLLAYKTDEEGNCSYLS